MINKIYSYYILFKNDFNKNTKLKIYLFISLNYNTNIYYRQQFIEQDVNNLSKNLISQNILFLKTNTVIIVILQIQLLSSGNVQIFSCETLVR